MSEVNDPAGNGPGWPGGVGDLERILELLPVAACLCDGEGRLVGYNRRAAYLWGREPALRDPAERYGGAARLRSAGGEPIPPEESVASRALRERQAQPGREVVIERPDGERRAAVAGAALVYADRARLMQALGGLVANAARSSEAGGRVRLTVEPQGNDAVVRITDTGAGIPEERISEIFEMFLPGDPRPDSPTGELGIGPGLVRGLIEMHGGSVRAQSDGPGRGSEFTVRLPLLASFPGEPRPEDEAAPEAGRFRILVVDDNRDSAASLALMLRIAGHETREAHDGVAAVSAAAEFRPQVVLLDIGLPRMNGYEACRAIRREPWGRDMVLIALTGWGQEQDRLDAQEAGFNLHLVKPVDPAALMKVLDGLVLGGS